ncbi:MAG: FAD binding domain-containing protein [Oscillospiraceae bacterium]
MLTIKNYVRAESLQQAYELNQNKSNRVIGGMLWLKMTSLNLNTVIDLSELGLDTIEETGEEFSIGAMVTLRQLELHPGLNAYSQGAVAKAVEDIVGVQFRNMATVGGSLFGRFGFSDVLTIFLAMDTYVELYKGGLISLEDFAQAEPDRDILIRVIVKKQPGVFSYQAMRNSRTDFPVLTCAASRIEGAYRAVIGARPMRAMVIRDEDGLLAGGIDADSARAFADYAAAHVPTGGNVRGSADYRTRLVRVLTRRALMEMGGLEHGD